jgi:hypothetical protein
MSRTFEEIIKEGVQEDLQRFSENYDHDTEEEYEHYGDTYVSSGSYVTEESEEKCVEAYKDEFDETKAYDFIQDVLMESPAFVNKLIEFVKENDLTIRG